MLKNTLIGVGLVLVLEFVAISQQAPPQRGAAPPREPKIVRIDPAFDAIAPANAQIEKVAGGFGFVEGPVWTRQGSLLLSDIPGNVILRIRPDGQTSVFRQPMYYGTAYRQGFHIGSNGLTLDREGRVYMTARTSLYRVRLNVSGKQPCC